MRYLFLVISILVTINMINSEEKINETDIIQYYDEFCKIIQNQANYKSEETFLNYYSVLNDNKELLSKYLQSLDFSKIFDVNSLIIIAGIFKLSDLEEKINSYDKFSTEEMLSKCFYYYQISGNTYYLEILKSISSLVPNPYDYKFQILKIDAIDLLGWTCDKNILSFLKQINKDRFDGMISEIYSESVYRLELFLRIKSN